MVGFINTLAGGGSLIGPEDLDLRLAGRGRTGRDQRPGEQCAEDQKSNLPLRLHPLLPRPEGITRLPAGGTAGRSIAQALRSGRPKDPVCQSWGSPPNIRATAPSGVAGCSNQ